MNLTARIFIGMVAGILIGALLKLLAEQSQTLEPVIYDYVIDGLLGIGASIFVASLKVLVVPLVLISLICGVTSLGEGSSIGKLGGKAVGLYLLTTALAISFAIGISLITQPGVGADFTTERSFSEPQNQSIADVLINIFPTNPVQALADGNMLQIIVFAILLGLAMRHAGEAGARIISHFNDWNQVVMKLVVMIMHLAPYGVFCLLTRLVFDKGLAEMQPLIVYFFTVVLVLLVHGLLVYPSLLVLLAGLNPLTFFKKIRNVQMLAFSTASSSATLPITMRTLEERLGVDKPISSFIAPLGATINMDGTAIMQGVATVFIAQAYGLDIGMTGYLTVILMATMASIGTAGIPSVGLVTLSMVLTQVNLPVEGIALIIGVDRLLDMLRTAVNVTGDAAVTCVVAKSEQALDEPCYRDAKAGELSPTDPYN